MMSGKSRQVSWRLGLWLAVTLAAGTANAADNAPGSSPLALADLQKLVSEHGRIIRSFRLEGTVCAIVPDRRLLALEDGTAAVLLEVPEINPTVRPGDRLAIASDNCALVQGEAGVKVGTAFVVDNDGHHSAILKSGKVFLPAGFQPIHLAWFNGISDAVLKLEWEGPGFRRQGIPNKILWRKLSGETNREDVEPGLDYQACNAEGNSLLDFENQVPVARGVATNFNISYRARAEHTALFFDGYLKAPCAGTYTFYLTSDDGARLQVGEPRVTLNRLGATTTAKPMPRTLNQARADLPNSSWIELEGEVAFAAANRDHLSLDLITGGDQVQVTVVDGAPLLATNLLQRHLRLRGICEFALPGKMTARVLVPSLGEVDLLDSERPGSGAVASTNAVLTTVALVKQLRPGQVKHGIPVKLKGVLIGVRPVSSSRVTSLKLQDATGGISVFYSPRDWTDQPHIGEMLEVEGVTGSGVFAPLIEARSIKRLGNVPMPEPIHPRWDQLMNGTLDCVYVEIQGILIAVSKTELSLFSADGTLTVILNGNGIDDASSSAPRFAKHTLGAGDLVRLRGCCMPSVDQQTQHIIQGQIQMNCPLIAVDEAAPVEPFSLPAKKIADLLGFDPRGSALQRTKLTGQIIYAKPGKFMALDGQRGFRILTALATNLEVGDLVEAVGFPNLEGPSPILQQAQVRKIGHAPLPPPVSVSADRLLDRHHDSTLIRVDAVLVGKISRSRERILELQAGPCYFLAMQRAGWTSTAQLVEGSRLRLVGVYDGASAGRIEGGTDPFSLLLVDDAGAVKVIVKPSWWTAQHTLIVAAMLAGALGLAFVWITLLRQQVEERTSQLRKEIQERERVEKDRAIEQERTRLARDLHDELGAGLTTVGLMGGLIKNPCTPAEKKNGYLEQITLTAHTLVTALDEIVWAINPQNDSIASSANYYAYFAQPFLNAAGIACRLEIFKNLSECPLDARIRHGIFLAFKEALNNVVRHSGATEVTIRMLTQDEQLIIAISDNGNGMDALRTSAGPGQDGMAGMRDRLAHLGGACLITSQAGAGTTVQFQIPLPLPPPAPRLNSHHPPQI